MITVRKVGGHVVMTFKPENRNMLTQAPASVVLSESETKDLVRKIEKAVSGENTGDAGA